jgi:Metallo-peptidase family M12/Calx-beta domain/Bacterial pre-peptidase C-terminal domain
MMKRRQYSRAVLPVLVLCLAAAAAMLVSPAASGQGGRPPVQDIEQVLASFDRLSLDPAALLRGARETGRVTLQTTRGTFALDVEPFDIRAANYRAVAAGAGGVMTELPPTPSNSWRGKVSGSQDTFVRLVLDGERFQGIIITPGETYFVEPARAIAPAAAGKEFVFYAESAVKQTEGECGVTLAGKVAERARAAGLTDARPSTSAMTTPTPEEIFAPMPEADVAVEADFEFTQLNGGNQANTIADMNSIMTQVDGIYESQLGMSIRVVFARAWVTNTDPYTLTDAEDALFEFADSYDDTFGVGGPPVRDLTHMFTGKEFDGSTIGIAFTGVACVFPPAAYGISESKFLDNNQPPQSTPFAQRVGVTAHEMGHNFGASHPNQESPVPPNCVGSIMNSSVTQNPTNFCQFSLDQITSHVTGDGGSCLTRLTAPGCSYAISPASGFFTTSGGTGNVNVTATGGCAWGVAEGAPWVTFTGPQAGTGNGATSYTVAPNNGKDGPRRAFVDIGGQQLQILQQGSPACLATATPIAIGQTLSGTLASTDCIAAQPNRLTAFEDIYTFVARAGQRVRIEMTATTDIDTYLYLFGPDGSLVAENDDIQLGVNTNSRIPNINNPPPNNFLLLPQTGVYTIAATSFENSSAGSYTLRLSDNAAASSVALSSSAFSVNEDVGSGLGVDGTGFRVVTVNRTGDTSGTATVDYATSDGTASRRSDYIQTLGTLVFAPNETSKTFTVFVVDDVFQEAAETAQLTLSNPVGTTLGATQTATLTINSNDVASGPSPVRLESLNVAFFVRQQYLDFLNREPDASGFGFWQNEINSCGADAGCRDVRRINVSAAFFQAIEFQETGYLAYRTYKTAYGDTTSPGVAGTVPIIRLEEFLPDTRRIGEGVVVGPGDAWKVLLEANKQAYFLEFILRPRFITAFPLSMTASEFVNKLNQNSGFVLSQGEIDQLVAQLNGAANQSAARASVLRAVAEHPTLALNEFRRAFVLMQYYGYLRRNPNDAPEQNLNFAGWAFWLGKLNENNGNFVQAEMVKAFLDSFEYIDRFGTRP